MNEIKKIVFNKTSNILLNSGIIGLYIYLKKQKENNDLNYNFNFQLNENSLEIESDNLMKLLEDVYYKMGKDYYDLSSKKSIEEKANAYYVETEKKFYRFPKMYSYGFAGLLTNNAAGKTKNKENTKRIKDLEKKSDIITINIFKEYFKKENLKLLNEIYFNEPYIKIPRLDFEDKYFIEGDKICYLTGEKFQKLLPFITTSPLLSGMIKNSESFGDEKSRQMSWKAAYISRFSPVLCLYMYIDGLDKIVCYFFNSDNLTNTYKIYNNIKTFFLDELQLQENNYMRNFSLEKFENPKKDSENKNYNEFVLESEILFMLIYTYYRKNFFNINNGEKEIDIDGDLLNEILKKNEKEPPVSLVYLRSDSFASTMRPCIFEEFNHYKFIIGFFIYLEKEQGIDSGKMRDFLNSLKYISVNERTSDKKWMIERKSRNEILNKILNLNPIHKNIQILFYRCFNDLISNEKRGWRDFNLVLKIFKIYEKTIKFGGNENMNEELREYSINLGTSIGIGIKNYLKVQDELKSDEITRNIKVGRKYIVALNKTRTIQQFLDEIVRIQNRFEIIIKQDLLKNISEDNWDYIKSFCIISALNILNIELSQKNQI